MSWPRVARERAYRLEEWKRGKDPYLDKGWREKVEDLGLFFSGALVTPPIVVLFLAFIIITTPFVMVGTFFQCIWDILKSQPAERYLKPKASDLSSPTPNTLLIKGNLSSTND